MSASLAASRPLIVPEGPPVRPSTVVCQRCQGGSRELLCWSCGQLPDRPVPLAIAMWTRGGTP